MEGRKKGFSGNLEADLTRSEAKIVALAHPDPNSPLTYRRDAQGSITAVETNEEDRPKTREDGAARWREIIEQRFLRGQDVDFDYSAVDSNDAYDDRREETLQREEGYFDGQEEEYVGEGGEQGQTGVQDF